MKYLSHSPFVWISATLLSGLLYFFAFHFFPKTFPIIHLDITMDLKQALKDADLIAQKYNFGPLEHRNAAMFHTDALVKTFVELEGGGKDAFIAMMEEKLYMPYTWRVRHFKEFEKNETTLIFTPNGIPYGFVETISENIPGAQLSEDQARAIVESDSIKDWNINLHEYTLVESSQKKQPHERIDHTFVYERTNKKIGEGLCRLKIVISGDKITEVIPFVKVPEAFNRRYAEMYSANTTIAWAASLIMIILYLIGGCCFGLYWIMRKRWALFKQPLMWGIFLACANVLVLINQLPFLWMHYNSAHSSNGFLTQLVLSLLIKLFSQTAYLTIVIATAESLTRKAFGHHPQLWSLWSTENSATYAIFGRTLAGYLMVGFNCAFVIAFYLLSARYLQWWTPSEMLFDPNILATYLPWLSPIAVSLNAGFIEECLFRAIPLASAALLGTRYGKKNWWIGGAFILQAIVFSAAHASYPTQPSYTRLIELLIPSLIWGATYLRWGLLPTIITHCVYDIIWFSLPIFVSHAPQALLYKIIIILITLLPLLYVIYARIQQKKWTHFPQSSTNQAWQPSIPPAAQTPEIIISEPEARIISSRRNIAMITLGILGLIIWIWKTPFVHDGITITIDRNTATKQSNDFLLHNKNIVLNAPWKTLPLIFNNYKLIPAIATQHTFIWKESGKELYHSLLASYLEPAHWTIRYAQFDTDIIQRSEEHKIMLYDNTILRHHQQLPESSAGEQLTQEQARKIAHDTIKTEFNLDAAQLTEISAEQGQLPSRRNWLFIFSNPAVYPLQTGQARISILIAGDKVIDAARTIHVPEEWERSEQNKQNILNIIAIIFLFILLFFLLSGAFIAFRRKKEYLFSKPLFFTLCGIITGLFLIECINIWPSLIGSFNTSAPFTNQLFQHMTSLLIPYLIRVAFFAITITYALGYNNKQKNVVNPLTIGTGISIGLFFAGIMSIAHIIIPENAPLWPNYDALGASLSWLSSLISSITQYLFITVSCCLLYALVDVATDRWRKNRLLFVVLSVLYGISTLTLPSLDMLPLWVTIGTIIGLIALIMYRYIIRYNYSLIPLATCSFTIMQAIQQGIFNAYPGAAFEAKINIGVTIIIAGLWYWYMNKKSE